ncbi:MAG: DUF2917 domain-containing protein [Betaproteobacteria bacterium]
MKVEIENAAIELMPAQLLRLRGAAGVRIVCRSGTVWVTQEGVLRDEFLRPGEALTLRSPGLTLAEALGRTLLAFEARPPTGGVAIATRIALPVPGLR